MTIAKTIAAAQRTKQFNALISAGLQLASTEKQLKNGTLVFTGKIKKGRKTIHPKFAVTARGAVISNEFTARWVDEDIAGSIDGYRQGLAAVSEIFTKRTIA